MDLYLYKKGSKQRNNMLKKNEENKVENSN